MSISTGPVIPMILQSYMHYVIDDSKHGSTDHIINLNTVEMRSLRPWTKVDSTLSYGHFAEHRALKIKSAYSVYWLCSLMTQENVCCPNFQNTSLTGNLGPQIRLPDGRFGQFRAIGPMELLRPGWPDVLFRDKYAFLDTCIICDTPNRPLRNTSLLPTGHWGMDAFDTTMGQVKHIKNWKPSRGAQMCNFWTYNSNPISAYRGDSQPASEERPLLPTGHWGMTAVWGDRAHSTLRTLSGGPDVLFRDK